VSSWQKLASILWPVASREGRVHGDGRFAILVPILQTVLLYETVSKRQRGISSLNEDYKLFTLEA
jgi:hypothetical protein